MDVTITPHKLEGVVPAIASKSMAHRLLILSAISPGITNINCNTTSLDIDATVRCLEALGARVAKTKLGFRVVPIPGTSESDNILQPHKHALLDCGESGSTLRFMLPLCAALGCDAKLTGHGRLSKRPLSPLFEQLEDHGAKLSEQGVFPLSVEGRLRPGRFVLPGNVSSQFTSGLLMAAPLLSSPIEVVVSEPVESRSYIDMTVKALEAFGIHVGVSSETIDGIHSAVYTVTPGDGIASPGTVSVEGDWSNAAFWLASGAIGGYVVVTGLDTQSAQGDRAILACLAALGARVGRGARKASAQHDKLSGRTIDVSEIPDLAAPLAAVAAYSSGTTRIANAGRLRLKESDRLESITAALSAMGSDVSIDSDSLVICGRRLSGGTVDAANDHRIAMMAAIAAAYATGPTTIRGAECVAKSYPRFFEDFRSLGGQAKEG